MVHNRFWQAFFAIVPLVLLLAAIIGYIIFILQIFAAEGNDLGDSGFLSASYILENMFLIFLFIMGSILVYLGSLVFYIVHAVLNPNLKENNLLLVWILLFVFVNGIGQLIYWCIEIVGKRKRITLN